jgi:hypothetical protein
MTKPTTLLLRLDEAHSALVDAMLDSQTQSAGLRTIASLLTRAPALDLSHNDVDYWRQVCVNLNEIAYALEHD